MMDRMDRMDRMDTYGTRIRYLVYLALALTISYLLPTNCWTVTEPAQEHSLVKSDRVDGEILVRLKAGVGQAEARAILARYGMTISKSYTWMKNLFHVRLRPGLTVEAALEVLKEEPSIAYAEPNYIVNFCSACPTPCIPNDPEYINQWGLANIQAEGAWAATHGSPDVVVAVLDTGIDYHHPDLTENKWVNPTEIPGNGKDDDGDGYIDDVYGFNAVTDTCSDTTCLHPAGDPLDDDTSTQGHGTRLAGIIGAVGNNSLGIAGVGWHTKLMPIKIRHEPDRQGSLDLVLSGMDYLITKRNQGVNIPLAHLSILISNYSLSLQNGIDAARDAGILLIWSAGNNSKNVDTDPTNFLSHVYDNVLFVGAIDNSNALAGFSNYGQVGIQLAAPGVGIVSTVRSVYTPQYQADDGTSYATPFVTGVAALLSAYDPTISYTGLKAHIISATTREDGLVGKVVSGGRLNAADVFSAPITDLRPPAYQLARIEVNHKYYTDRSFTITSIPQGFDRLWWVRTKNADKVSTDTNHINIGLGRDAIVYVAYDPRAISAPDWLSSGQGWTDTGLSIGVSDKGVASLRIYSKPFSPGMVVLGGNQAAGYVGPTSGDSSNYVVLIRLSGDLPPSTPGNLSATAVSSSAIDLSWTASTDDVGVAGYTVYRGGVPVATTSATGYRDTGLTASTMYTYAVRAFDAEDNVSPLSDPDSAVTLSLDTTPPSKPTNVQAAVVSSSQIDLSWTASTDNVAVEGYKIYRNGILAAMRVGNSYSDSGLAASTTYTYTISSYDAAGNGSPVSSPVSATTSSPPPTSTLPAVKSGSVTLLSGSQSATVTIAPVDITKAFLVFGMSFNDANPGFSQVTGQITNATTLTFRRSSGTSAPAVTVKWYVAEFLSGVSVQRGSTAMDAATKNIPLTAVDTARSFPIITYRNSGSSYTNDDFVKAKITSSTNLELSIDLPVAAGIVEWQVIEFADSQVQSGSVSFGATDSVKTATMSAVDTGKSWLIYTYKTATGTTANIGQKLVQGLISNGTTVTFDRANTGQAMDLTWYLVEFTDGTTVQQGSQSFGTTETQKNVAISVVDPARSLAAGGYCMRGGRSSYAGDDNPGVGWMTLDLTSGSNLQIKRNATGNAVAGMGWFVVNFSPMSEDTNPPVISGVASGSITSTGAAITWTTDEASDSQVEYGTTAAYGNSSTLNPTLLTGHNINLSNLSASTLYHYRVMSRDAAGNLSTSADFTFMTGTSQILPAVKSGSVTLLSGSQSATVTIAPVDITKAFLVFGMSFNDANPGFSQVTGQITNATTLTFRRSSGTSAPAVTVKWYVAEFLSGVSVQRGSTAMDAATKNIPLTAVDTARSFPIITYRNSGSSYTNDDFVKAKITSSTNLELSIDLPVAAGIVEWQVIEFADSQVQSGSVSFGATDSVKTATMSAVDTGKSWLIYTYKTATGTTANIGQKLVQGLISNGTTVTFDRANTGQAMDLTWYLVEFTDGTTVQQGSQSFGTTETQKNVAISVVDPARSLAAGGYCMRGGRSSYAGDDNPGVGWMTLDLTSGSNLQIKRNATGNAVAGMGWFVVNFQ